MKDLVGRRNSRTKGFERESNVYRQQMYLGEDDFGLKRQGVGVQVLHGVLDAACRNKP